MSDPLRWISVHSARELWHLSWDGRETLCTIDLRLPTETSERKLSVGPPSPICADCQDKISRDLGL